MGLSGDEYASILSIFFYKKNVTNLNLIESCHGRGKFEQSNNNTLITVCPEFFNFHSLCM